MTKAEYIKVRQAELTALLKAFKKPAHQRVLKARLAKVK